MTLRTLPIFLAVLAISCSVKEDRISCPCRLSIDLSDASEYHGTVGIYIRDETDLIYSEEISPMKRLVTCEVTRKSLNVIAIQGLAENEINGRNVIIPYGKDSDCIMIHTETVNCIDDDKYTKAEFRKNWTKLTIEHPDGKDYPYRFQIKSHVSGFDIKTLNPVYGSFLARMHQNSGNHTYSICLPRHDVIIPQDGYLTLQIIDKSDGNVVEEKNLHELIRISGFDWARRNLDDISIYIDNVRSFVSITVTDWKSGMEQTVII